MHKLEELREMLMDELNECVKKDELSTSSLDIIDKLTHSIKSIDTILAMEEAGYSNDGGNSYARGRGRNAKRDSRGRYSRNSYDDNSYDDGSYGRYYARDGYARDGYARRGRNSYAGYSREDAKDELMSELQELQMDAKDEESRQMIKQWMKQLEQ